MQKCINFLSTMGNLVWECHSNAKKINQIKLLKGIMQ
jgi:hypothetical protein